MAQTLYAYVLGTDLDAVASAFETRFDAFMAERTWTLKDVWVVHQRVPEATDRSAEEWDLGFNLTLPKGKARPARWTDDLAAIATLFASLHGDSKRAFVIGLHDTTTGATDDLFKVESASPDIDALVAKLTAATTTSKRSKPTV